MDHALAAVDQHQRAGVMGDPGDLRHRIDRAQHVRHVGDGDHPGPLGEQPGQGLEVQPPVVQHRNELQDHALALAQKVPGHDIGVVLHLSEHDLVAFVQRGAQARGDEVDRLGPALGEDDLPFAGVEEARDRPAGRLIGVGGLVGQGMQAAVDVGVGMLHRPGHRLDHRPRLLGAGGAVQIDQRLAVHLARKDRELGADLFDVEGHQPASLSASQARIGSRAASFHMRSATSPTKASISRPRAAASGRPRWRM